MSDEEFQAKLDKVYSVIKKQKAKSSKKNIEWLMKICNREFGLVESLIENFLDNVDKTEYASKILMILRQLLEIVPEAVEEQYRDCDLLPPAITKYISITALNDLTPDAFFLLKQFFQEK